MHSQYCATTTSVWLQNILITSEGNSVSLPAPLLPSLWLPLISFLSLWIYLFQTLHVNGIISTRPSCLASFTQLSIFRVHLCCGMNVVLHSFFLVKSIPLYGYIHHMLLIHSSVNDGWFLPSGWDRACILNPVLPLRYSNVKARSMRQKGNVCRERYRKKNTKNGRR